MAFKSSYSESNIVNSSTKCDRTDILNVAAQLTLLHSAFGCRPLLNSAISEHTSSEFSKLRDYQAHSDLIMAMSKLHNETINSENVLLNVRNPDVTFKDVPFYDLISEVIKPTTVITGVDMTRQLTTVFFLEHEHLIELYDPFVQVQFRIAALVETTSPEVEDNVPDIFCLKINNTKVTLPSRYSKLYRNGPFNITSLVRRSTQPQTLYINMTSTEPRIFVLRLVRELSTTTLIQRLKGKVVRDKQQTLDMFKSTLLQETTSDLVTLTLRGSLICPLGKNKMTLPCRGTTCTHLQCFDATSYIKFNALVPKWICPICSQPADFKSLVIDGLFLEIAGKAPIDCKEFDVQQNGVWTPVKPEEINEGEKPGKTEKIEIINID